MKIALASDDGVRIAAHPGRCQGFVIYEVVNDQAVRLGYRANAFTGCARGECDRAHAQHRSPASAHRAHAPLLEALGECCAVVARGMGPQLSADLTAMGIDACVCEATEVEAAAADFAAGRLTRAAGRGCCER
jgi:predicted Fe-Mo cluster-binding NifX family protein